MKLATYASKGQQHVGAVVADDTIVIDLAAADKALARREKRPAHPFFTDMLSLLNAGTKGLSAAKKAAAAATEKLGDAAKPDGKTSHALSRVRLKAPMPNPRKIFCLAGNYQDHIEEGGGKMAVQDKETPRVFMKPPTSTVISPGDSILIPPIARSIDWEGELAVVMGRKAKGVKTKDALKYVAGYTVMNDVSERDLLIKNALKTAPRTAGLTGSTASGSIPLRPRAPGSLPGTTYPTPRFWTSAPTSMASANSTTTPAKCSTRWLRSSSTSRPSSPWSRAISSLPELFPASAAPPALF